jgi:sigma-B regulation protein RsbU (phosphoserine phosphatase)
VTEKEQREIERLQRRVDELDAEALLREGRIAELIAEAVERDGEIRDLEAMRDVLAPSEIRVGRNLDVKASFTPAADGVAGDFYVVTPGPDEDSTVVAVGDVSGKGVEAARRATFVRTSLATFARFVDDPCRLLELSNQVLVERTGASSIFVTAVVVVLHPHEGRLEWASAGHPAPVRLDSGETLEVTPTLPLGIDAALTCRRRREDLVSGTGILLFTDGLTEAHRPREPLFGDERVAATLRDVAGAPAGAVVRRLEADALAHAGDAPRDDVCIVAARVNGA